MGRGFDCGDWQFGNDHSRAQLVIMICPWRLYPRMKMSGTCIESFWRLGTLNSSRLLWPSRPAKPALPLCVAWSMSLCLGPSVQRPWQDGAEGGAGRAEEGLDSGDDHPDAAPVEFVAPGPVDPSAVETMPFHVDEVAFSFSDAEDQQPEEEVVQLEPDLDARIAYLEQLSCKDDGQGSFEHFTSCVFVWPIGLLLS